MRLAKMNICPKCGFRMHKVAEGISCKICGKFICDELKAVMEKPAILTQKKHHFCSRTRSSRNFILVRENLAEIERLRQLDIKWSEIIKNLSLPDNTANYVRRIYEEDGLILPVYFQKLPNGQVINWNRKQQPI